MADRGDKRSTESHSLWSSQFINYGSCCRLCPWLSSWTCVSFHQVRQVTGKHSLGTYFLCLTYLGPDCTRWHVYLGTHTYRRRYDNDRCMKIQKYCNTIANYTHMHNFIRKGREEVCIESTAKLHQQNMACSMFMYANEIMFEKKYCKSTRHCIKRQV